MYKMRYIYWTEIYTLAILTIKTISDLLGFDLKKMKKGGANKVVVNCGKCLQKVNSDLWIMLENTKFHNIEIISYSLEKSYRYCLLFGMSTHPLLYKMRWYKWLQASSLSFLLKKPFGWWRRRPYFSFRKTFSQDSKLT